MSKSNLPVLYRDPITHVGFLLGGAEEFAFHLHETGYLRLSTEWNQPNVLSPFWRLYWTDRPGAWIECAGRRLPLEPGSFWLIPSYVTFDTHGSPRPVNHFWIHFSLHPDLTVKENVPIRVPCRPGLRRQVAALARKVKRAGLPARREIHHLCSALLHQVFADPALEAHQPRFPPKMFDLLNEIEHSLAQPIPITTLALQAGLSRGGFIRWFHQHMEMTPARYVLGRRIAHACRLLKFSTATIEEISERLGFANRSHFSRAFARQMALGPASFRKS